jgi:hypothetical protein
MTLKLSLSGVGSTFPAASIARTLNLKRPSSRLLYFRGESQSRNCLSFFFRSGPLRLHSKVEAASLDVKRNLFVADPGSPLLQALRTRALRTCPRVHPLQPTHPRAPLVYIVPLVGSTWHSFDVKRASIGHGSLPARGGARRCFRLAKRRFAWKANLSVSLSRRRGTCPYPESDRHCSRRRSPGP